MDRSILLVDDEPSMLRYAKTLLSVDNYDVDAVSSGPEALEYIKRKPVDLMLLDVMMPGMDGLQTLRACKETRPDQKVVMISCLRDASTVVQAIKLGAADYVTKPFVKEQLDAVMQRTFESFPSQEAVDALQGSVEDEHQVEELEEDFFFLAASPAMKQIRAQVNLIARVDVPVLLLGESGVGKEILAKLIHKLSIRSHRAMMKVNCAALPAELLESELFGYEAGAFTGAQKPRAGKFEVCNKGTILLDEIGEMPTSLQAKLLHVLQDGQFSRLGSRCNISVDVRVLAATNIDVQQAIQNKTLREDLYYRLNAFTMNIPPLRERKEEIPLLLKHFMNRLSEKFAQPAVPYSERMVQTVLRYDWPGNLRELGNFVKRLIVLQDERMLIADLEGRMQAQIMSQFGATSTPEAARGGLKALVRTLKDEAEYKVIEQALHETNWNRKLAAAKLNISYKALLYKMKQYQIARRRQVSYTGVRPATAA